MQNGPTASSSRDPVVVLAADEKFAMPLATTIRSALENLDSRRKLLLYVLDGGIRPATKQKLLQSWPADRFEIEWIGVDSTALAGLPVSGHVNVVAYYRILIPRLLPTVERVIYLDSDLIVLGDLGRLWDCDLSGELCLAAQDCAAPYLDATVALENYAECGHHLGAPRPVANYRELGLPERAAYFNSGVMLIDLQAWRTVDVPRQLTDCLERYRPHALWWDQYALNVVLAGQWGPLDIRWNQGSHTFRYPNWRQSPFDRETFQQLRDDPYIVHFTTKFKPWKPVCLHPLRSTFYQYLDRTAWAGWRPSSIKRLAVIFELLKSAERRLRHGRRRLLRRVGAALGRHDRQPTAVR